MSEDDIKYQIQSLLDIKAQIKTQIANAEEDNKTVEDTNKSLQKFTEKLRERRDKLKKDIAELTDFLLYSGRNSDRK